MRIRHEDPIDRSDKLSDRTEILPRSIKALSMVRLPCRGEPAAGPGGQTAERLRKGSAAQTLEASRLSVGGISLLAGAAIIDGLGPI